MDGRVVFKVLGMVRLGKGKKKKFRSRKKTEKRKNP